MSSSNGLIALVGDAPHAWTMVNALRKRFGDFWVIVERASLPPPSGRREEAWRPAIYSMKAAALAAKVTRPMSYTRLAELQGECDAAPVTGFTRMDVDSLNSDDAINKIRLLKPKAVFVASTGMLRKPLLEACGCPVGELSFGREPRLSRHQWRLFRAGQWRAGEFRRQRCISSTLASTLALCWRPTASRARRQRQPSRPT